jgi:two-component system response regulator DevR
MHSKNLKTSSPRRIRTLLVDAHEVMQLGIAHVLRIHHIDVVDACDTSTDAVRLAQLYRPDLILMEIQLADGPALDACRTIRVACPQARVIFLTSVDCDEMRRRCLAAGSHGYLLNILGASELAAAIHALAGSDDPIVIDVDKAPVSAPYLLLSPQERKIPPLIAAGKTNKEIAEILGLSDKTVKNYLSNIYLKLQVNRRSQLAAVYARHVN